MDDPHAGAWGIGKQRILPGMNFIRREMTLKFGERVVGHIVTILRLLGLFMALIMALVLWKLWALHVSGVAAPGRIVGLHESEGSGSASSRSRRYSDESYTLYSPIVEFEAEGRTWRFTSSQGGHGRTYDVGQETIVLYNPKNPQQAEIKRSVRVDSQLGVTVIALFLSGLFFFWISCQLPGWWARFGSGSTHDVQRPSTL